MSRANYRNKPKTNLEEGKSGWVKTLGKIVAAGSGGSSAGGGDDSAESGASKGIRDIGDAGASIVKTYKDKQKSSSGGTGGAKA